ncbi:MAG: hypothetical protein J7L82_02615 [Staphylothermus sp.]|nr:hypothetical protein [Staphylothermus sp.]
MEFIERVKRIRGYRMAKAGIEFALWDLYAKHLKAPLYKVIGGIKNVVESGISIGVIGDMDRLLKLVSKYLERGYRRVKIKIALQEGMYYQLKLLGKSTVTYLYKLMVMQHIHLKI